MADSPAAVCCPSALRLLELLSSLAILPSYGADQTSSAGHVPTMAQDDWAYVVLMAAMHVTDDTQLLNKVIMPELVVSVQAKMHIHCSAWEVSAAWLLG